MSERPEPYARGKNDAYQDRCENVPFSSTGGLESRQNMTAPDYILPEEREAYLAGYAERCREMFGEDWRTCEFGWSAVMTISDGPTDEEKITNAETMRHILTVRTLLAECASSLIARGTEHDRSKLADPEAAMFNEYTRKLAKSEYGSDEYKGFLKEMGPALEHHYAHNRHHPEWHDEGVAGMDLFDLLEMLCDWKAATLRHETGDIRKSLEINAKRFGMPESLVRLLANTIPAVEEMAGRSNAGASYPHVEEPSSGR
ncbi:MAG TPA: DUF5662 family protein [Phycisphaerae bacterium]|nr:DUF5662 family protein [Phycisphaerae bacterium]HUU58438.1 DUF5662 family protein [Phycisphaerae bacterium]